jgi:hypothetical protein
MKKLQLKMTSEESHVVELCLLSLTEEQIADCRARILKTLAVEVQQEDYEALLEQTMGSMVKRNVRGLRLDRILQREGLNAGKRSPSKRERQDRQEGEQ